MAFCNQCGKQLKGNESFCTNCGAPLNNQQPKQGQYQQPNQPYGQPNQGQYRQPTQPYDQPNQGQYQQPNQPYGQPTNQGQYQQNYQAQQPYYTGDMDIQQNKNIAWLSYLSLLFLIPMLAKKESELCRYHVKQGVTLFCIRILFTIASRIFLAIVDAILPGVIHSMFSALFTIVGIGFFVVAILGIVNAAGGKKQPLPIIGEVDIIAKLLDKIYYKKP